LMSMRNRKPRHLISCPPRRSSDLKDIALNPDGAVVVTMIIDAKYRPFIKTNSVASIGTDGLMGNRLVNINAPATDAPPVEEGTIDRKSTRLNSSHVKISYAVFCFK